MTKTRKHKVDEAIRMARSLQDSMEVQYDFIASTVPLPDGARRWQSGESVEYPVGTKWEVGKVSSIGSQGGCYVLVEHAWSRKTGICLRYHAHDTLREVGEDSDSSKSGDVSE